MTPEMEFRCLFVSRNPDLYCTITKLLYNLTIMVDHHLSSLKATDAIATRSHDLIVIDWEEDASPDLLRAVWNLANRKRPIVLVISDDGHPIPGAHISLRRPVTRDAGAKALKDAYSRMLSECRLAARHPLMVTASASDESGRIVPVIVTEISNGGIGLSVKHSKIEIGTVLSFNIQLPQTAKPLHVQARVVWTREYGVAGCEIICMPSVDRDILCDWLKTKTQVKRPLVCV